MIPMSVEAAVAAYVKPYCTKETKSGVTSTFEMEDGTLSASLAVPKDAGIVKSIDLTDEAALTACKVTGWKKAVKNENVAHSQTFTKLANNAKEGYAELLDHANTLAAPVSGN